jgi:hypothetical protein
MVTGCVLMLAWPMTADQFANARLLMDDLCTAVPVNWGGLNAAPGGDEVASMLNTAIGTTREVGRGRGSRTKEWWPRLVAGGGV